MGVSRKVWRSGWGAGGGDQWFHTEVRTTFYSKVWFARCVCLWTQQVSRVSRLLSAREKFHHDTLLVFSARISVQEDIRRDDGKICFEGINPAVCYCRFLFYFFLILPVQPCGGSLQALFNWPDCVCVAAWISLCTAQTSTLTTICYVHT